MDLVECIMQGEGVHDLRGATLRRASTSLTEALDGHVEGALAHFDPDLVDDHDDDDDI